MFCLSNFIGMLDCNGINWLLVDQTILGSWLRPAAQRKTPTSDVTGFAPTPSLDQIFSFSLIIAYFNPLVIAVHCVFADMKLNCTSITRDVLD